ncbi:uncharacterized protein LOC133427347 [Cololabis saira]|uniref:uncharacterized protein LOC133427347 n=1 Tax=Cololabis saira TaxID=129043 RepID=UPI002AD4DB82|nr:uncharacterized protein LOC133427347 [Cololabis saira]
MSKHMGEATSGSSLSDLRLVLLGNIGCGKTSTADTVLGQLSPVSPSASRSCRLRRGSSEGRNVTLVEAPRWYWNGDRMADGVRNETEKAVTMVAPGPHAVLLLVPIRQFTEVEARVPAELEELFGREVLDHTLVLLTCGDYLMGSTAEEYLQKEHAGLRQMIERCGRRYHVINNRQPQDREQVQALLEKVERMAQKNGIFSLETAEEREVEREVEKEVEREVERDLERQMRQRKEELMENYSPQKKKERESVASKIISNIETFDRRESMNTLDGKRGRGREERDGTEGRVSEVQVSDGLHSSPVLQHVRSELQTDVQLRRTPNFSLNAVGGDILPQVPEATPTPEGLSNLHHRIPSIEETTPEASPTGSPDSPVFTPPSSPTSTTASSFFSPSSPLPSSPALPSSSPELRLVMLGRCGAGKSLAGNIILGQDAFESHSDSFAAITQTCEKKKALVKGRSVAVVDTPDWFNSERTPDEVQAQISSCIALSSPGPHAFLLCVPLDQPAKTELQALSALETVFGPDAVARHTLVLFTHADRLRESGKAGKDNVEAYIAEQRRDLLKLVEKCRDRFHVMETGGGRNEKENVAELLEKVQQTVEEAGGQYYSCPAFQEAENRVRQRQLEIARERRNRKFSKIRGVSRPYMQLDAESENSVAEEEIEETRDEAEMSVSTSVMESLPDITRYTMSPSLLHSIMEKMESSAKMLPKLLADGSVWVGDGAKKVKNSDMWGKVGSGAQNAQKMVAASPVWGKVGVTAGHVSKAVRERVPQPVVDGSAWVGSGAKAVAASPMWEKVGSGAKVMADGAKNLAQSPVWEKVGAGAKTGAKLVADGSARAGAGIGAGAKRVAQSPVWGKVGSGARAGAKAVSESPAWEKIVTAAKRVPIVVIAAALLGLVLGLLLGGVIGGAVGAAAGSAVTEVGRRKFSKKSLSDQTSEAEAAQNVDGSASGSVDAAIKGGGKSLKTE